MSTVLTERSRSEIEPPAPTHVRRRWPRWLTIVASALLFLLAFGFLAREVLVGNHRPFRPGSGFYGVHVQGLPDREIKHVDTHGTYPEPGEIVTLPFVEGRKVQIVFPLYNRGPWDVTLGEVSLGPRAPEFATLLQPVRARLAPGPDDFYEREALPFEPSVIKSEENRLLVLEYRFVCQRGGVGVTQARDTIDVKFELFGTSQWQQLSLPFRLVLTYPPKGTCTPLH